MFQIEPCEKNGYVSFDESKKRLVQFPDPSEGTGYVAARERLLENYDAEIKRQYGDGHFHGEEGLPVALFLRETLNI